MIVYENLILIYCFNYFSRIFAFVAKKSAASNDNQCHLFCELEASQPAAAIVSYFD